MEARIAVLEEIARSTAATLVRMDRRMDRIEHRIDANFRWLLGILLVGFGGILGAMAHGFHWF